MVAVAAVATVPICFSRLDVGSVTHLIDLGGLPLRVPRCSFMRPVGESLKTRTDGRCHHVCVVIRQIRASETPAGAVHTRQIRWITLITPA
jgi:hypothetical protein